MIDQIIFHLRYLKNTSPLRKSIIQYCKKLKKNLEGDEKVEIEEIEKYLKRYCLTVFPYKNLRKYKKMQIEVRRDTENYPYIQFNGKNLYGPSAWTNRQLRDYYLGLIKEQDKRSPHCYINDDKRRPAKGSIIADIGAAEGIFALDWIENAGKVYLFECDPKWIPPLKKTFGPWMDKVEIIEKFIGKEDDLQNNVISLDSYFADKKVDFLKADIEGAEIDLLQGGELTFRNKIKQTCLCAYHNQDDEKKITGYLEQYGFLHEVNHGYMLFAVGSLEKIGNSLSEPYLRRGVIYGERA